MKNEILIVHFTHHKCGTVWFYDLLKKISKRFNLKLQLCKQEELSSDTNIWFQASSWVNLNLLKSYTGSHMIRDLRDIIVSGYFYHLWCNENWCSKMSYSEWYFRAFGKRPANHYAKKTYKEILNELPKEEGILFEMNNSAYRTFISIYKWNYNNPNIIEICYEDFIKDNNLFRILFKHYGFNKKEIEECMKIVKECSFKNITKRELGEEDPKSHLRKGTPGDWKNHFTERHKEEFKRLFDDVLIKLGYEKDNNW